MERLGVVELQKIANLADGFIAVRMKTRCYSSMLIAAAQINQQLRQQPFDGDPVAQGLAAVFLHQPVQPFLNRLFFPQRQLQMGMEFRLLPEKGLHIEEAEKGGHFRQ
ncbi:hypothetical protein D3C76_1321050 [compost metagenome]